MEFVRINATMPKKILRQIDDYAEEMQEDRSTAIRQLLAKALLEQRKYRILDAFKAKKLSLREAAEALGVDYWELQDLLRKEGIPVTDATEAEIREGIKRARQLAGNRGVRKNRINKTN